MVKYFIQSVANGWVVWKGKQPAMPDDKDYAGLHVFTSRKAMLGYLNRELKDSAERREAERQADD